jgi:hypothetical protein
MWLGKPDCGRLARPRKRHYTFARRNRDQFARSGFGTAPSQPQSVDLPGLFVLRTVRNGNAATGSVMAKPTLSLPSSIG